jgi:hypothetical protein
VFFERALKAAFLRTGRSRLSSSTAFLGAGFLSFDIREAAAAFLDFI